MTFKAEKYGLQWQTFKVTGQPTDNRDLVNWTRGSQYFCEMRETPEGPGQIGFNGRDGFGFLEPGEFVALGEDGRFHRFPAGSFEVTQ